MSIWRPRAIAFDCESQCRNLTEHNAPNDCEESRGHVQELEPWRGVSSVEFAIYLSSTFNLPYYLIPPSWLDLSCGAIIHLTFLRQETSTSEKHIRIAGCSFSALSLSWSRYFYLRWPRNFVTFGDYIFFRVLKWQSTIWYLGLLILGLPFFPNRHLPSPRISSSTSKPAHE